MRSLLSTSCLVLMLLATSFSTTGADAIHVAHSVKNGGSKIPLPHVLKMKHKKPVFHATKDGSHGSRLGMGWRDAGKAIPMSGGVLTQEAFFTEVTIGTAGANGAGVTFDTIVDTGSSNTNVPGINCFPNCGLTLAVYNASASATSKPLKCQSPMCQNCIPTAVGNSSVPPGVQTADTCKFGQPACSHAGSSGIDQCAFQVSYGGSSSSTEGVTVQDRACLGDVCTDDAYIGSFTNQVPAGTQTAGILGLAFPHNSCTPNCQPTLLDMMAANGVITQEQNMFGMCLTPGSGGFIDLGALNSSRYTASEMKYTKVVQEHWYNVEVKGMKVNGTLINAPSFLYNLVNDGIGAFADSGTTVVLISPIAFTVLTETMEAGFSSLPGVSTLFGGQCTSLTEAQVSSYPEMSFVLAGMDGQPDFEIKMNGHQYLMNQGGGTRCLGIAGVPSIGAIFGDVIMQNYYINFDRHGRRLGFAPLTPGSC